MWGGAYGALRVVMVERVENKTLFLQYRSRYLQLLEQRPAAQTETALDSKPVATRRALAKKLAAELDPAVRECYLFHGTRAGTAEAIIATGFEERLANLSGLYGAGAYFADKSSKSDQYTVADRAGVHSMFVARVMLGAHVFDARETCNDRRILDPIPGTAGVRYSALLGLYGQHREFVVYDGHQAYPEYLVHYRRIPE